MSADTKPDLIPVTLLTGFLGSGKTTLLNHIVRQPALADALVIINEFGEMPIDHALVAHSTENLVVEMSSGCLCCTIRSDLVETLLEIKWRSARGEQRPFRRVLIETTGLADPAPIIHTLMTHPQIANRYRLNGIVVTLDLAAGLHTLDHHPEVVKQAAIADCLLLTKADLATDDQHEALARRLDGINPAAPRWHVVNGEIAATHLLDLGLFTTAGKMLDIERWLREDSYAVQERRGSPAFGLLQQHAPEHHGHGQPHHDVNRHDDRIRAFCFALDAPISQELLSTWLDILMAFVGSDILRIKGILNIEGSERPLAIHGVQHIFHPPVSLPAWPTDDRRSRLVFITRNVGREIIEETFHAFHDVKPQVEEARR